MTINTKITATFDEEERATLKKAAGIFFDLYGMFRDYDYITSEESEAVADISRFEKTAYLLAFLANDTTFEIYK